MTPGLWGSFITFIKAESPLLLSIHKVNFWWAKRRGEKGSRTSHCISTPLSVFLLKVLLSQESIIQTQWNLFLNFKSSQMDQFQQQVTKGLSYFIVLNHKAIKLLRTYSLIYSLFLSRQRTIIKTSIQISLTPSDHNISTSPANSTIWATTGLNTSKKWQTYFLPCRA